MYGSQFPGWSLSTPVFEYWHPSVTPSHTVLVLVCVSNRIGWSDDISSLRLGYKRHGGSPLWSLSLSPLSLIICDGGSQLPPHEDVSWRGWHGEEQKSPANSYEGAESCQQPHEWASEWIRQPQSSLQRIATLAHSLTTTSYNLSQSHPDKLLLNFRPTETIWDNKCLLFEDAKFWGNLLSSNRYTQSKKTIVPFTFLVKCEQPKQLLIPLGTLENAPETEYFEFFSKIQSKSNHWVLSILGISS